MLSSILPLLFAVIASVTATPPTPGPVDVTAIATRDGASILQCWSLTSPFTVIPYGNSSAAEMSVGTAGPTLYTLLQPGFDNGFHNAPAVQFVAFVYGEAVISLPNSTQTADIVGGRPDSFFIATDTADVSKFGHATRYPQASFILMIPTQNKEIPPHNVLHEGPCSSHSPQNGSTSA